MLDYYTVGQFAEKYGKDPGNIRRMLIAGKIRGEKIGKQWLIPKGVEYPADGRVHSGNYRNWRKKFDICKNSPELMMALNKMSKQFSEIYGGSLYKVILYGSYARGEQMPDSDVDIAVILKTGETDEKHDEMLDVIVEYELNLAVTLSVIPIEYENYLRWKKVLPFYKNLDKEGIILWKAA